MDKVSISFSDGTYVILNSSSLITPVVNIHRDKESFASILQPLQIDLHTSHGLIPPLLDILCNCNFFYIDSNYDVVYSSNNIVKIENL